MASSDTTIRNVYRQVTGREIPETLINSARGVPDDQLAAFFSGQSGGGYQPQTADDYVNSVFQQTLDAIQKAAQPAIDALKRSKEFDEKNPFTFDEILARQSAEERLNPYYEAELRDYLTGIYRTKGRTIQDEEALRNELNTTTEQTTGRIRRTLEDTIQSTQNAADDSGLLFSGKSLREEGKQAVQGEEDLSTALRQAELQQRQSKLREQRTLEDLASSEATYRRRQTAEQETALTTDVEQQKKEAQQQRELERQQYIGYPIVSGQQSLSSIFGIG